MRGPRQAAPRAWPSFGWIRIRGESMWPALRCGDLAGFCARRFDEPLCTGDVVVARMGRALIAHRVVEARLGRLVLRGDACVRFDPPVPESAVLGRVELVRRQGQVLARREWDRPLFALARALTAMARRAAAR